MKHHVSEKPLKRAIRRQCRCSIEKRSFSARWRRQNAGRRTVRSTALTVTVALEPWPRATRMRRARRATPIWRRPSRRRIAFRRLYAKNFCHFQKTWTCWWGTLRKRRKRWCRRKCKWKNGAVGFGSIQRALRMRITAGGPHTDPFGEPAPFYSFCDRDIRFWIVDRLKLDIPIAYLWTRSGLRYLFNISLPTTVESLICIYI